MSHLAPEIWCQHKPQTAPVSHQMVPIMDKTKIELPSSNTPSDRKRNLEKVVLTNHMGHAIFVGESMSEERGTFCSDMQNLVKSSFKAWSWLQSAFKYLWEEWMTHKAEVQASSFKAVVSSSCTCKGRKRIQTSGGSFITIIRWNNEALDRH